jgi:predicted RNA-binding Zn-ribbon protein involved in translation (DUF1610 family)
MKKYCTSCGSQIVYSVTNKPKFCASCGAKLDLGKNYTSSEAQEEQVEVEEEVLGVEEEESAGGYSANINKLDFEVERFEAPKETLGGLIDNPVNGGNEGERQLPNNENFLNDFRKEAGSIRKK